MWIFIAHLPDGFLDHGTGGPTRRKGPATGLFSARPCAAPGRPSSKRFVDLLEWDTTGVRAVMGARRRLDGRLGFAAGVMPKGRTFH